MDLITLSLAKGYANKVAAGFNRVEVQGSNLVFTLNDGSKATVAIPAPADGKDGKDGVDGVAGKDGLSVTNITIDTDGSLLCHMSDGSVIDAGKVPTAEVELTDYYTKKEVDEAIAAIPATDISNCATKAEVNAKQDQLVSGSNIKTINGSSLLGGGDIVISGGIEDAYDTSYYANEIEDTVNKLREASADKSLIFAVVTDTHLTDERMEAFEKTLKNIKAVNDKFSIDFLFHLGDMIDSDPSRDKATYFIEKIVNGFRNIVPNSFIINGNHDDNSSKDKNPALKLQPDERYAIFNRFNDIRVNRPGNKSYFYFDVDSMGVRFICLNSTIEVASGNSAADSWGFPQEEITWLQNVALNTKYKVILTSHMGLVKNTICHGIVPQNGSTVINVIKKFQQNGGTVIGMFIGHCHWDYITTETGFNTISTDCWKLDDTGFSTLGAHPSGAVKTTDRTDGTVTENVWDIVVVNVETGLVQIIRFGAGEDRSYKFISNEEPETPEEPEVPETPEEPVNTPTNLLDTILTVSNSGIGTGENTPGGAATTKGVPYSATTMRRSDFIQVSKDDIIDYNLRGAGPWAGVLAFYTSNDESTVVDVIASVDATSDVVGKYTCPSDGYIRVATRIDYNDGHVYVSNNILETILTVSNYGIGTGKSTPGGSVTTKGATYSAATMRRSDFIQVKSGDVISYKLRGAGEWAGVFAFYTSNNESAVVDVVESADTTSDIIGTYTCSSDGYFRVANRIDYSDGYLYINA